MTLHDDETLVFDRGDVKALPHTLEETRHLTLTLVDSDVTEGTAVFELHNPGAEPDSMVSGLVEENEDDVESANRWRDRLHLPEKAVPVDTTTVPVERIDATLHEKLQIGDRVWVVTDIAAGQVSLTPGRDHESPSLANTVENAGYAPGATGPAEGATAVDEAL